MKDNMSKYNSFREGTVKTIGTDMEKILLPMRKFGEENRTEKKQTIIEKILKFFGIIVNKVLKKKI